MPPFTLVFLPWLQSPLPCSGLQLVALCLQAIAPPQTYSLHLRLRATTWSGLFLTLQAQERLPWAPEVRPRSLVGTRCLRGSERCGSIPLPNLWAFLSDGT